MMKERDRLVKFAFPELRKFCEQRGVSWCEIDLRWGISDEQKAEGNVLPVCLREIRRCRPWFIGILGDYYGSLADITPAAIHDHPWVEDKSESSVTDLEIQYGVLREPWLAEHAFFYFRKEKFGPLLHQSNDSERKLKLLKERIRKSGFPIQEFTSPETLATLVLADFFPLLRQVCPSLPANRSEAEESAQRAFQKNRARFYIPRRGVGGNIAPETLLDQHAQGSGVPLLIKGETGIGKSSLLTNWASKYETAHPKTVVVAHFASASNDSTSWMTIARRIIQTLNQRLNLRTGIPADPAALRVAFSEALTAAAERGRAVLVIDGLNQIEDSGALPLAWLPTVAPENIRLILSSVDGPMVDEADRRGWKISELGRLKPSEAARFIFRFLKDYGRKLPKNSIRLIGTRGACGNPLFLLTLLDELRVHGSYTTLTDQLEHYLESPSIVDLFCKVLERYEADYEAERSNLVADSCSLLAVARRGLSESELSQLLGTKNEPLPAAFWSPLSLAMDSALITRSGLLGFSHGIFRQAVIQRYFTARNPTAELTARRKLVKYFREAEGSYRKTDELPWQLQRIEAWGDLAEYLQAPQSLAECWGRDEMDVRRYWSETELRSSHSRAASYAQSASYAENNPAYPWTAAILLAESGATAEALRIREALTIRFRSHKEPQALAANLAMSAHLYYSLADYDSALRLHLERERILRAFGPSVELAAAAGDRGTLLLELGQNDLAAQLFQEQEIICRSRRDYFGLQASLGNRALACKNQGKYDEAITLLRGQEDLCRRESLLIPLSNCLGNKGETRYWQGRYDEAAIDLKKQAEICRLLGYLPGLTRSIGDQALVMAASGDFRGAEAAHTEEGQLAKKTGDPKAIAVHLVNCADTFGIKMGQVSRGIAFLQEARKVLESRRMPAVEAEAKKIARKLGVEW